MLLNPVNCDNCKWFATHRCDCCIHSSFFIKSIRKNYVDDDYIELFQDCYESDEE